jgi:hypothetical protein
MCTFAAAKVRIALALSHQYSDKESLNLQLRRSGNFFLGVLCVRRKRMALKKKPIFIIYIFKI